MGRRQEASRARIWYSFERVPLGIVMGAMASAVADSSCWPVYLWARHSSGGHAVGIGIGSRHLQVEMYPERCKMGNQGV